MIAYIGCTVYIFSVGVCLPIRILLSVRLSVYLCLSVGLCSLSLTACFCLSCVSCVSLPVCLSHRLYVCLFIGLFVSLVVCQSVRPSNLCLPEYQEKILKITFLNFHCPLFLFTTFISSFMKFSFSF